MNVLFERSFGKSLEKLHNSQIKEKVKSLIILMEKINDITELPGLKGIKGHPGFYRIRLGDYRVGFEISQNNEILLILVAHRKDIYKRFPK